MGGFELEAYARRQQQEIARMQQLYMYGRATTPGDAFNWHQEQSKSNEKLLLLEDAE